MASSIFNAGRAAMSFALACLGAWLILAGAGRAADPPTGIEDPASEATRNRASPIAHLATGAVRKFRFQVPLAPIADVPLIEADQRSRSLSEWRGKTILVNFWATWCFPCREEMPQLARLQQRLNGAEFEVLTVSIDRPNVDIAAFLRTIGASTLPQLRDPSARSGATLGVVGMPTSLLIDRHGRLVGRLQGNADWSSDDAIMLIKAIMLDRADVH